MLQAPTRARERILLIGTFGAGKSKAWSDVFSWLQRTNSEAKVFVLDTDYSAERVCPKLPDDWLEDVSDYGEYMEALDSFYKMVTLNERGRSDDFLVIDHISRAWDAAQRYYTEQAFGKDKSSFFLEYRSTGGEGSAFTEAYGGQWQIINSVYNDLITKVKRWPGHVIACAPSEPVQQPGKDGKGGDDPKVRDMFGRHGVKPAGQKMLGFEFMTVLNMMPMSNNQWVYTTIKDIEREYQAREPIRSFTTDYLIKVAGWTS